MDGQSESLGPHLVEGDYLDGCEIDMSEDEDLDPELLALFPTGEKDEAKAAEWKELFNG